MELNFGPNNQPTFATSTYLILPIASEKLSEEMVTKFATSVVMRNK